MSPSYLHVFALVQSYLTFATPHVAFSSFSYEFLTSRKNWLDINRNIVELHQRQCKLSLMQSAAKVKRALADVPIIAKSAEFLVAESLQSTRLATELEILRVVSVTLSNQTVYVNFDYGNFFFSWFTSSNVGSKCQEIIELRYILRFAQDMGICYNGDITYLFVDMRAGIPLELSANKEWP